jgi:hypothetical protein
MQYSARTFAGHLRQFARSVDIVDKSTFDGVRELIIQYVRRELGEGAYFELLREQQSQSGPILHTFWSSEEKLQVLQIHDQDGGHTSPVSAAFDTEKPLWIVTHDRRPLDTSPAADYRDQWSDVSSVPPYESPTRRSLSTLIVVPLRRRRPLGAFCLESPWYLEATDVARSELGLLGDAMATLLELWEVNETHSWLTAEAVADLRDMLTSARFPKLAQPQIFVAHSSRADEQVAEVIRTVLRQYESKLQITFWNEISDAGNITVQVGERIAQSKFGICYLSEPADGVASGRQRYVDNPNVVFEAGMLHALTNAADGQPSGWIPIREKESPPAPFDFASERILEVTRTATGVVAARFEHELRRRVNSLLGAL